MSNDTWTLAEISRAILSYNSAGAPELAKAIKNERELGKEPPAKLPSAERMRRYDDQQGSAFWPLRR
jgi:hypothetical protein